MCFKFRPNRPQIRQEDAMTVWILRQVTDWQVQVRGMVGQDVEYEA